MKGIAPLVLSAALFACVVLQAVNGTVWDFASKQPVRRGLEPKKFWKVLATQAIFAIFFAIAGVWINQNSN